MAETSVISEEMRNMLGVEQEPLVWDVEKGHVRKFVEAIGDHNPLWQDEEYARRAGYGNIVALPTLLMTWGGVELVDKLMKVECPLPRLFNVGTEMEFYKPVLVGDVITTVAKLADLKEKTGNLGKMLFMTNEIIYKNQRGELVAKRRQTFVRVG